MIKISKKETILREVTAIIAGYSQKLTLRQIYYRLVAKLIIPNKLSQYKYLSALLVEARKSGKIRYDSIEDRTREVFNNSEVLYVNWKRSVNMLLNYIMHHEYSLPSNLYQRKITLLVLEKQALEGIFRDVVGEFSNVILIVCRGYNSLTQIWELRQVLSSDDRQVHCRFFSDFDPSGMDIMRNFVEQCKNLGIKFKTFKRVALNKRQINRHGLPFAPTKLTDSRARNWAFPGVVELDALDPNLLEALIRAACNENWSESVREKVRHLEDVLKRRYRRELSKRLIQLAEELKLTGGY